MAADDPLQHFHLLRLLTVTHSHCWEQSHHPKIYAYCRNTLFQYITITVFWFISWLWDAKVSTANQDWCSCRDLKIPELSSNDIVTTTRNYLLSNKKISLIETSQDFDAP